MQALGKMLPVLPAAAAPSSRSEEAGRSEQLRTPPLECQRCSWVVPFGWQNRPVLALTHTLQALGVPQAIHVRRRAMTGESPL